MAAAAHAQRPSAKRILFVMPNARYLRLYGSVVIELGHRGHEVALAYDTLAQKGQEPLSPEGAPSNVRCVGVVPPHGGRRRQFLIDLGAATDYVRYLSPRFSSTPYLRMRMEKYLPARCAPLKRVAGWPQFIVDLAVAGSRVIERTAPVDPAIESFLRRESPDAVVVSPLVLRGPGGAQQTQVFKAARQLGIPAALAVGSWDHLSSKGMIRVVPDIVLVWNEVQKREAVELHQVRSDRVVVTGAQPFDHWFEMRPTTSSEVFFDKVGLPRGGRMVLYVGSSRGIAQPEKELAFVRQWVAAIRRSADQLVRDLSILVRPHPFNMELWQTADLSDLGAVAVFPSQPPTFPMNPADTADYFHSLYYSQAIVGINTSAMIEAAIVGRGVYTIQVPEFASTQQGTVHFQYLVPGGGGCVQQAPSFAEHVQQLTHGLADPDAGRDERERFVRAFVRPCGLDQPATRHVADAIEGMAMRKASQ